MKKLLSKILVVLFTLMFTAGAGISTVSAENAGATRAKKVLNSRMFYLEYGSNLYDVNLLKRKAKSLTGIAVSGGKKMLYLMLSYNLKMPSILRSSNFRATANQNYSMFAPAWYTDGANYFRILSPKQIVCFTEEQMADPYINPSDGEINNFIKVFVNPVPEELSMFVSSAENPFTYIDSGNLAVDGKTGMASYDRYSRPAKNALNQDVKTEYAYVYYDAKNNLLGVDRLVVAPEEDSTAILKKIVQQNKLASPIGSKYVFRRTVVTKMEEVLPKDFAKFDTKAKYVQPWVGDMNELIEQRVPAENFTIKE